MQQIIQTEFKNHTIIAVAHRPDTTLDFDGVVVMDKDAIVECDAPEKLLRTSSKFRELYETGRIGRGEDEGEVI
jgi:ABC-type multidrug transport system fused ATPase/permease subunit